MLYIAYFCALFPWSLLSILTWEGEFHCYSAYFHTPGHWGVMCGLKIYLTWASHWCRVSTSDGLVSCSSNRNQLLICWREGKERKERKNTGISWLGKDCANKITPDTKRTIITTNWKKKYLVAALETETTDRGLVLWCPSLMCRGPALYLTLLAFRILGETVELGVSPAQTSCSLCWWPWRGMDLSQAQPVVAPLGTLMGRVCSEQGTCSYPTETVCIHEPKLAYL